MSINDRVMKFSVVIPMYNVEAYLERCLGSFASQAGFSAEDFELILVNDGSTDMTAAVAEQFKKSHNDLNIKVLSQANQGLSRARNAGLECARGEYVWFVDSDDWVAGDALARLDEAVRECAPDVVHFRAANHFSDTDVRIRREPYQGTENVIPGKDVLLKYDWEYCSTFYLYRRQYLLDAGLCFYPGIFHEDNEFTPRMLYQAVRVRLINDVLYSVYQNPNSITRTVNPKKSLDLLTVAGNLFEYAQENVPDAVYRRKFYDVIADSLNWALISAGRMERKDVRMVNEAFRRNRNLFYAYRHSSVFRFRFLGYAFAVCPDYVFLINFFRKFK